MTSPNATWIVVGQEQSGDEDENVSAPEAFGFGSQEAAQQWLDAAETFDGRVVESTDDVRWLLDLLGVRLRDPDVRT